MLQWDLRDYSDAYIVLKGTIAVTDPNDDDAYDKKLTFNNKNCITNLHNKN